MGRIAAAVLSQLSAPRPARAVVHGLLVTGLCLGMQALAAEFPAGQVTLLPLPAGALQGSGVGLNDWGLVAGTSGAGGASPVHATLWQHGVSIVLPGLSNQGYATANDANERGWVVGVSVAANGDPHATLWRRGSIGYHAQDLGTQGTGRYSTAVAVNASGLVAGYSTFVVTNTLDARATLWPAGGQAVDLGTLGGSFSSAYGLNRAGQVVGASATANNSAIHAVLWRDGNMLDLGPGYANQINDSGHIVGMDDASRAVRWLPDGTRVLLGTLGGSFSSGAAVNNAGQIAGWASIPSDTLFHAVYWQDDVAVDLNDFLDDEARADGWYLSYATGINAAGLVTGAAFRAGTAEMRPFVVKLPRAAGRVGEM